jgi:flagellar biogenesis protein FliO
MDPLPLGLVLKLLLGLGLCFGLLVGAAWFARRVMAGGARSGPEALIQVRARLGLGPGTSLVLVGVRGRDLLIMQTKEGGNVLWEGDAEESSAKFELGVPKAKRGRPSKSAAGR